GLQIVGGVIETGAGVALGVATSWTGVGAVAGGAVAIHGVDTLQSGIRQLWTGTPTDTFTSQGMQAVGVDRNTANLIDAGISIGGTLGTGFATRAVSTAPVVVTSLGEGTSQARILGPAGEAASGITKNTARIPSITGTAKYRIPDGLTRATLSEVKNVQKLSYTSQLKDFSAYATATDRTFELFIRPSTQLSGPLQASVDSGKIILKTLPK
ncbi:MAG: putative toxin, partial [Pseudomonadota bacterium]